MIIFLFESAQNHFTCNLVFVNAIIVVLNAEQDGNDVDGEGYVVKRVQQLAEKDV